MIKLQLRRCYWKRLLGHNRSELPHASLASVAIVTGPIRRIKSSNLNEFKLAGRSVSELVKKDNFPEIYGG